MSGHGARLQDILTDWLTDRQSQCEFDFSGLERIETRSSTESSSEFRSVGKGVKKRVSCKSAAKETVKICKGIAIVEICYLATTT
jgi:hypothetical protein